MPSRSLILDLNFSIEVPEAQLRLTNHERLVLVVRLNAPELVHEDGEGMRIEWVGETSGASCC